MLRISLTNNNITEYLDLPQDVKLSLTFDNPWFNYSGSYSLPVTLPNTAKNLRLLKYPNRLDQINFQTERFSVIVEYGVKRDEGTLNILSYTQTEGIEITITLLSSSLKDRLGNKTLAEVFGDTVLYTGGGSTPEAKVLNLIDTICSDNPYQRLFRHSESNICAWFPVLLKDGKVLNCPYPSTSQSVKSYSDVVNYGYSVEVIAPYTEVERITHTDADGDSIEYPKGFFFSPFLKVWFVLKRIVEYAGFSLSDDDNCFYTDDKWFQLCLLNNTVDSCLGDGKLYARHLLPDIKAIDFINEINTLFGVAVFIKDNRVSLKPIKESLEDIDYSPLNDWSGKIAGVPQISYGKKSAVALSCAGVEKYDDTLQDANSIQEVEKTVIKIGGDVAGGPSMSEGAVFGGIGFYLFSIDGDRLSYRKSLNPVQNIYYSHFLNWIPESEDIINMEIKSSLKGYESIKNLYFRATDDGLDGYLKNIYIPYIGEGNNKKINITHTRGSGETVDKTLSAECPFMLAYNMGCIRHYWASGHLPNFGSAFFHRQSDEELRGKWDDCEDILRPISPRSLSKYSRTIGNGHTITAKVNLTPDDILNIDFSRPVLLMNKICYIIQVRVEVSENGINVVDVTFKTEA